MPKNNRVDWVDLAVNTATVVVAMVELVAILRRLERSRQEWVCRRGGCVQLLE